VATVITNLIPESNASKIAIGSANRTVTMGEPMLGMKWDASVPGPEVWAAVLRVLKPGAMLMAFGGSRTHHRHGGMSISVAPRGPGASISPWPLVLEVGDLFQ